MSNADRLEAALDQADAFGAAFTLGVALRDAGMSQAELLDLFDRARERHCGDSDERRYDAILGVMDLIVGWCLPSKAFYSPSSEESHP